jgi:hypothetical protein
LPSIEKVDELLRAVSPDATIVLGKRAPAKSALSQGRSDPRGRRSA